MFQNFQMEKKKNHLKSIDYLNSCQSNFYENGELASSFVETKRVCGKTGSCNIFWTHSSKNINLLIDWCGPMVKLTKDWSRIHVK